MSRVKGTVNRIWHNRKPDGSGYWVLSIDGQQYSTWDRNLARNIEQGDLVEFLFTESGRYRNLTFLKRLGSAGFATADKLLVSPESLWIVRMNCLRTATEMISEASLLSDQKICRVISIAKRLEDHVLRSPGDCPRPTEKQKPDNNKADSEHKGKGAR